MKNLRLFFLVALLFVGLYGNAQITITGADVPSIGMVKYQGHDTLPSRVNGILPGNAGANQTWDFTTLTLGYSDTIYFISPAGTPYASQYPNSNMAIQGRLNNMPEYMYFNKQTSGVYAVGIVGNLSLALNTILSVPIIPQMTMLRTPSTYQSTYSENYSTRVKALAPASLSGYGDSIKQVSWVAVSSLVDGHGSLITPSGTFLTIRQKIIEIKTDTSWLHTPGYPPYIPPGWQQYSTAKDTTITYRWWAYNVGIPVLEITRDAHTNAKTKSITWYLQPLQTGYTVSGNIIYNNTANTAMNGATVSLMSGLTQVATTTVNANGYYSFANIPNGTYNVVATTTKAWGGVSATDVLKLKRHIAGLELLIEPVRLSAADANNSGNISATDVLKVARRIAGLDLSFTKPDWVFDAPTSGGNAVTVNGANVTLYLYSLCTGDVNGSFVPVILK